jgi:hypothetical protein
VKGEDFAMQRGKQMEGWAKMIGKGMGWLEEAENLMEKGKRKGPASLGETGRMTGRGKEMGKKKQLGKLWANSKGKVKEE